MDREGDEIEIKFQPVSPPKIQQEFSSNVVNVTVHKEQEQNEKSPLPVFRPYPNTSKEYNFDLIYI